MTTTPPALYAAVVLRSAGYHTVLRWTPCCDASETLADLAEALLDGTLEQGRCVQRFNALREDAASWACQSLDTAVGGWVEADREMGAGGGDLLICDPDKILPEDYVAGLLAALAAYGYGARLLQGAPLRLALRA